VRGQRTADSTRMYIISSTCWLAISTRPSCRLPSFHVQGNNSLLRFNCDRPQPPHTYAVLCGTTQLKARQYMLPVPPEAATLTPGCTKRHAGIDQQLMYPYIGPNVPLIASQARVPEPVQQAF
jgi:hypothetical protein